MGIRMALGATQRYVVRQVVWQGARLALVGLALGLAGAFGLTRFLSGLLFGVEATDPVTFLAVPGMVLLAALLASWVPAQRATAADPMSILRAS
jgi:ABC-type antimicrobial peptide transport system permease subunit